MLMDQNTPPSEGGVFVEFFGLPVTVSRAPAGLIHRSGAPVMLGICRRQPDGRYVVSAEGPFTAAQMGRDDVEITQFLQNRIEAVVRAEPGQWLWMYKRWKYVPDLALMASYPYYARPLSPQEMRAGSEKQP
jgi:KDO2-lipid IV(A) lauroyltransferase